MAYLKIAGEEIKDYLPHREPFLFVDRIEIPVEKIVVGFKTFSSDEPFFKAYLPQESFLPGALIIEACAQVSAFILLAYKNFKDSFGYLVHIENFNFLKKVKPGETLKVISKFIGLRFGIARSRVEAYVNEKLVASGIVSIKIVPHKEV